MISAASKILVVALYFNLFFFEFCLSVLSWQIIIRFSFFCVMDVAHEFWAFEIFLYLFHLQRSTLGYLKFTEQLRYCTLVYHIWKDCSFFIGTYVSYCIIQGVLQPHDQTLSRYSASQNKHKYDIACVLSHSIFGISVCWAFSPKPQYLWHCLRQFHHIFYGCSEGSW